MTIIDIYQPKQEMKPADTKEIREEGINRKEIERKAKSKSAGIPHQIRHLRPREIG